MKTQGETQDCSGGQPTERREVVEAGSWGKWAAKLLAENERLRTENYTDLLDQMDEAWGQHSGPISRTELTAFLLSRATHKPATALRARLAQAETRLAVRASTERAFACGDIEDRLCTIREAALRMDLTAAREIQAECDEIEKLLEVIEPTKTGVASNE